VCLWGVAGLKSHIKAQLLIQAKAVLPALCTATVSFVASDIVKFVVGTRVPEEEEREELGISLHGERACEL
jgi:Amt family ammonium transporter